MSSELNDLLEERSKNKDHVLSKRDRYETQGFADKDFEITLSGKAIKIWLPSSVFVQQSLLSLGDKVMNDRFVNFDEEISLTKRFYEAVCKHLRVDDKSSIDPETLELADLQSYAWLYWVELLYPLSLWSDVRARKAIQRSNV